VRFQNGQGKTRDLAANGTVRMKTRMAARTFCVCLTARGDFRIPAAG
jgi:hypothetical protein